MELKRGDIVTVTVPGDFGKPRPALVIQAEIYPGTELITVALITSDLRWPPSKRIRLFPSPENGLWTESAVMIDNVQTLRRTKVGRVIGRVAAATLRQVSQALALFLGLDI